MRGINVDQNWMDTVLLILGHMRLFTYKRRDSLT